MKYVKLISFIIWHNDPAWKPVTKNLWKKYESRNCLIFFKLKIYSAIFQTSKAPRAQISSKEEQIPDF